MCIMLCQCYKPVSELLSRQSAGETVLVYKTQMLAPECGQGTSSESSRFCNDCEGRFTVVLVQVYAAIRTPAVNVT
jgi:hypothetical protein